MTSPLPASIALQQVVDHDEHLIGRYPTLATSIHTAVTTDQPFDQPRAELLHALTHTLNLHAEYDKATKNTAEHDTDGFSILTAAMAAQHRSLAARVEELAQASTGLDVVALTRTIYATLNLTLDLERRTLHSRVCQELCVIALA